MGAHHGAALVFTGLFLSGLTFFSLCIRPDSRAYRWTQRVFWGVAGVWLCSRAGWMGMNPFTLSISAFGGCPAVAGLAVFLQLCP